VKQSKQQNPDISQINATEQVFLIFRLFSKKCLPHNLSRSGSPINNNYVGPFLPRKGNEKITQKNKSKRLKNVINVMGNY